METLVEIVINIAVVLRAIIEKEKKMGCKKQKNISFPLSTLISS